MAEKKYMIIDGIRAEFTDEKNILQVIHKVGIHVPTFCYYSDMSIYGACRMCVVEDERGGIIASCSTPPKNKMVIKTNTGRLHDYRKMILELLLASHCRDCTVCEKNGNCRLQMLAARFPAAFTPQFPKRRMRLASRPSRPRRNTGRSSLMTSTTGRPCGNPSAARRARRRSTARSRSMLTL